MAKNLPVFTRGSVCAKIPVVPQNPRIEKLCLVPQTELKELRSGQFFMLRAEKSKMLLGRPISVYRAYTDEKGFLSLEFLILEKGSGTKILADLEVGDHVELLGPLGHGFPLPTDGDNPCFIGGGIGVSPVAGLATTLLSRTYDFYACFKQAPYGLERVNPRFRVIATESGEFGTTKGMLDAILDAGVLKARRYNVVYACGPTPMLKYVQTICREAGIKAYLSLESHMACGMGACLGCSILTKDGMKKVCQDGPVFLAEDVCFSDPEPKPERRLPLKQVDLSTEIAGIKFKNPVIAASGTFGFGTEYESLIDVSKLGGICSKGLTIKESSGNPGVRVYEVPSGGLLNSIGLENPGVPRFISDELPKMRELGPVVIANLSGHSVGDFMDGARLLDKTDVDLIEVNISCPNVATGGMVFGMDSQEASYVVRGVKRVTKKPIIVKLTPNAGRVDMIALACVYAGADAISLVNTFQAMVIDIETGRPVFHNTYAGLSGPGIKPISLRMVHQVAKLLKQEFKDKEVPVIGLGGITTWQDAVEFIMAGASAIQVGTATFSNPKAMTQIISGIEDFMLSRGYSSIDDFRGIAL